MDNKKNYEIPSAELIEVQVEKGFAASGSGSGEDMNGNPLGF